MFLHVGFQPPTPEIMAAWASWFQSIAGHQVDQGGFATARRLSHDGLRELPWNRESITGYNILEAEGISAAEELGRSCPFIDSLLIYELRSD